MLGEAATTEITKAHDAQGFDENKDAAHKGGKVAGDARQQLEETSGRKVVSNDYFLEVTEKQKRLGKD